MLALLLVVAAASTASGPFSAGTDRTAPSRGFVDYAYTTGLLALVTMIAAVVWLIRPSGRWKETEGRAPFHFVPLVVALGVLVTLLLALLYFWRPNVAESNRAPTGQTGIGPPPGAETTAPTAEAYRPEFRWPLVVAIALVLLAALAAAHVARRRRPAKPVSTPHEFAAELATLVDIALDDLRAEPDPRRAVIAAYARMERALGAFGLPRRAFEAPFEYLERIAGSVVRTLPAARDLAFELTHLFERAKFSPHEIDVRMKDDAIETLTALRD